MSIAQTLLPEFDREMANTTRARRGLVERLDRNVSEARAVLAAASCQVT